MRRIFVLIFCIGMLWLCIFAAAKNVSRPSEGLRIVCDEGCEGDSDKNPILYVDAYVMAVVLEGQRFFCRGDWYEDGYLIASTFAGQKIMFIAVNGKNVTLVADKKKKTVTLAFNPKSKCVPRFDSQIEVVGKKGKSREKFVPGESFTVRVDVGDVECKYELLWTTDREDVLSIDNPDSPKTGIYVKRDGADYNPTITVTLYDPRGNPTDTRDFLVRIDKVLPPKLELSAKGKPGGIEVDFSGSEVYGKDNEIEDYCASLYYYGGAGLEKAGSRCRSSKKFTMDASRGDGVYKVVGYIQDSHSATSESAERTVEAWPKKGKAPNVMVSNDTLTCVAGKPCRIDAGQTWRNAKRYNLSIDIAYYDEKGSLMARGPEGEMIFGDPGEYRITVKASLIGQKDIEDVKEREVAITVLPDS